MSRLALTFALLLSGLSGFPVHAQDGFGVPEGFSVESVQAPEETGSVTALAFDGEGRIVFAREDSFVVRLRPRRGAHEGYREEVLSTEVTGAQGLLFDGKDLLVTGHGPEGPGLYRILDPGEEGDSLRLVAGSTGPVAGHGPHALRWGPDGHLYWIVGNHAGLDAPIDPLSPHRGFGTGHLLPSLLDPRGHGNDVRAPGGVVARIDLADERAGWELVAGGLRNAYDAAFGPSGELFTFDSDMEWDLGLPWYRPVRTHHVPPGAEFGWRTGSRKWPGYDPASLPGMSRVGRGSPTGIVVYRHHRYPSFYRDALFYGDWSRGRILAGRLERRGASFRDSLREVVTGRPLNVIDLAVGPDGWIYFTKGGWDTEGGIYRLVYDGNRGGQEPVGGLPDGTEGSDLDEAWVERALTAPQPRSAWGRARLDSIRERVGAAAWQAHLRRAAGTGALDARRRIRALELMHVHGDGVPESLLASLSTSSSWRIRSAAVYYLGLSGSRAARRAIAQLLGDDHLFVQRRACEALVRAGVHPDGRPAPLDPVHDVFPLLGSEDRFVRYAARELLVRLEPGRWRAAALEAEGRAAPEALLALLETGPSPYVLPAILERSRALLERDPEGRELLRLLRVLVHVGAAAQGARFPESYEAIGRRLLDRYPTGERALDRELSRLIGFVRPAGADSVLADRLGEDHLPRPSRIHLAYALRGSRDTLGLEEREAVLAFLAQVEEEGWSGGASFRGYLRLIGTDLLERFPEGARDSARARLAGLIEGHTRTDRPYRRPGYEQVFSAEELEELLVLDPTSYEGDAERGKEAFRKAFCASCHRAGSVGTGGAGPDLTTVGSRMDREDLVEAILYPDRAVSSRWASEGGEDLVEAILYPDRAVSSRWASEGGGESPMPAGLIHNLNRQEMVDLLLFLEGRTGKSGGP